MRIGYLRTAEVVATEWCVMAYEAGGLSKFCTACGTRMRLLMVRQGFIDRRSRNIPMYAMYATQSSHGMRLGLHACCTEFCPMWCCAVLLVLAEASHLWHSSFGGFALLPVRIDPP